MTVQRSINPIDDKEIVMVVGKVERIKIVEAEQTAKNIEYNITHTASIVVDNQWVNYISLGIKEGREPNITINTGTKDSPKWVQIDEGDDVKVIVSETVKGDKTYYNAKRTGIKLVKKGAGGSSGGSQGGSSGGNTYQAKPRDNTGQSTGHAINGAMNFILGFGGDTSNEGITELAKKVHNVTEKVKAEYKKMEPSLSDYDNGAASGQSVLTACKLVGTEQDFEQGVYDLAIDLLSNVVPKVMAHVKGEVKQAPPAKITRASPAKKAVTKAVSVVDETEEDDETLPF